MLTAEKGKRSPSGVPMGTDLALEGSLLGNKALLGQHPHLLAQVSVIRHLRDQRQHAHSPAPISISISIWASWPSAPCISAEPGRRRCSGSDSNQVKRAGAPCPTSGGGVPGSPLQPFLWTQPQVQVVSLGKWSPPFLAPSTSLLGPLSQFSTVIQSCP